MRLSVEVLEGRDTPAPFNYGPHPIDAFYAFPTADGRPIPGFDGPVQQAFCDVNRDGWADEVYFAGPGGSAREVVYSGRPGPSEVLASRFVFGRDRFDDTFRGGVTAAEGFDTDGDGVPDTLVASPGVGGGAVLYVDGPGGVRQIQVGPDDYRRGVLALDGFRLPGSPVQDVEAILDGGAGPVLVQASAAGDILASVYLPPGYDTFLPAAQGVPVDGVPTFGVQRGDDPATTRLFDAAGGVHHVAPLGPVGG